MFSPKVLLIGLLVKKFNKDTRFHDIKHYLQAGKIFIVLSMRNNHYFLR